MSEYIGCARIIWELGWRVTLYFIWPVQVLALALGMIKDWRKR